MPKPDLKESSKEQLSSSSSEILSTLLIRFPFSSLQLALVSSQSSASEHHSKALVVADDVVLVDSITVSCDWTRMQSQLERYGCVRKISVIIKPIIYLSLEFQQFGFIQANKYKVLWKAQLSIGAYTWTTKGLGNWQSGHLGRSNFILVG